VVAVFVGVCKEERAAGSESAVLIGITDRKGPRWTPTGLDGQRQLSYEEIGVIGAGRSRQLERDALHRMRATAEASTALTA
jgi:hypothetical protein